MKPFFPKEDEDPFSLPPPELTRNESIQVTPDESVVTVAYENYTLDRNTKNSVDELDRSIEWFVLMIALIFYVNSAAMNSHKKISTEALQESLPVTLFSNLHAFCGDEFLHLLTCLGAYEHRRPLAYWYRLYTILGEAGRLPLFYHYLQPELTRQMQPFYSEADEWQQNFMALILGYMLLNSFSRLYSELIYPKHLLSNQQREIFFKWRSVSPDITPEPSPSPKNFDSFDWTGRGSLPKTFLSTISERTEDSTPSPQARAAQEFFIRNGLSYSLQQTSNENTPAPTPSPKN